jgi:hypothetical protein
MEYEQLIGSRYDASYARAVLGALHRAVARADERGDSGEARGVDTHPVRVCTAAFRSQIADSSVRDEFARAFYPTLSNAEKALADETLRADGRLLVP